MKPRQKKFFSANKKGKGRGKKARRQQSRVTPLIVNEMVDQAKDTQVNNDITYMSVSQEVQKEKDDLEILSKCVFFE